MLSPEQVKAKAQRQWPKLLKACMAGHSLLPISIPLAPPSGKTLGDDFERVHHWIRGLKSFCHQAGLNLHCKAVNNRRLGAQVVPVSVEIPSLEVLLTLIGKGRAYRRFCENWQLTQQRAPVLQSWLQAHPSRLDRYGEVWPQVLSVVIYFEANPKPERYLRELDIPGVHSKFIEQHLAIVRPCLNQVLPLVESGPEGTDLNAFCRQFNLKYDQPQIRFRWLDPNQGQGAQPSDLSVPLDQFVALRADVDTVFITENKINGLSFPNVARAMVIFGLGYGIEILKNVPWLAQKRCVYWGDIDTHGFRILNNLRCHLPNVQSFLMDRETLLNCRTFWGEEAEQARFLGELELLSVDEQAVFEGLKLDLWKARLRLEQERVPMLRVVEALGFSGN